MADNPSGQGGSEDPGYIPSAVDAKARWARRALSPWVGRFLGADASSGTGRAARRDRHAGTALSVTYTNSLLDRVQRVVERGTVWRPDVGSLEPALVDRFAGAIVERFPEVEAKYQAQPLEADVTSAPDLILAGVSGEPSSAPEERTPSRPLPSFTEIQRAVEEARERASQLPSALRPAPPQVQRVPTRSRPVRAAPQTSPPGARVFSRVEEITPSRKALEAAPTPLEPVEVEPVSDRARAEEAPPPEPEMPTPPAAEVKPPRSPVEREMPPPRVEAPPVQREVEQATPTLEEEAPPPEPETPTPPAAEVRPPHPPVEREMPPPRVEAPPVQREVEQATPTLEEEAPPPEPETPTPPSAEPEPPRPPVEREMPPPRVEALPVQWEVEEAVRAPRAPTPTLEEDASPPEPEMPTPPAAEVKPPRPFVEREMPPPRVEAPPVQRQVEQATPPEPVAPAPPSAEVEPPYPPVEREMPPARPETPSVQREVEQGVRAPRALTPSLEEETPSPEAEPPYPPVEREMPPPQIEAPPVQREVEEGIRAPRAPAPSLGEEALPSEPETPAPPSAEVQPPIPPVEREVEERIRAPRAPTPTLEEEAPPPEPETPAPLSAEVEPPRPPVEREVAPAEPPPVQREPEFDESAARLDEAILARAASRTHLPLIEPPSDREFEPDQDLTELPETPFGPRPLPVTHGDVVQTKPLDRTTVLPQARVQAKPGDEEAAAVGRPLGEPPVPRGPQSYTPPGPLPAPRVVVMPQREPVSEGIAADAETGRPGVLGDELPLAPVVQSAPADLVQRRAVDASAGLAVPSEGVGVVQRVTEAPPETGAPEGERPELDLDDLARQVYPLIKRMLAVERERRPGR